MKFGDIRQSISSGQNDSQNKGQEVSSKGRLFNSCVSQHFFWLYVKQGALARIKDFDLLFFFEYHKGITNKHGFAVPSGRGQRHASSSHSTKQRVWCDVVMSIQRLQQIPEVFEGQKCIAHRRKSPRPIYSTATSNSWVRTGVSALCSSQWIAPPWEALIQLQLESFMPLHPSARNPMNPTLPVSHMKTSTTS